MNLPIFLPKKSQYRVDPYFFSNENINNKIYIAQPTKTVESALFCIDVWNSEKYNIGDTSNRLETSFVLYTYKSNTDIKKHFIDGKNREDADKYKVLQFKKNKNIFTVALLEYDNDK
jgi:hypothetical protein